jgi:hypothetical protein
VIFGILVILSTIMGWFGFGLVIAGWAFVAAAIVIFVSAVVRISHSFAQIALALTNIADTLRRRNP